MLFRSAIHLLCHFLGLFELRNPSGSLRTLGGEAFEFFGTVGRRSFQPLYLSFKFVDDSGLNVGKFHFVEQTSVFKLELLTLRFESCDLCFQIVHAVGQRSAATVGTQLLLAQGVLLLLHPLHLLAQAVALVNSGIG